MINWTENNFSTGVSTCLDFDCILSTSSILSKMVLRVRDMLKFGLNYNRSISK